MSNSKNLTPLSTPELTVTTHSQPISIHQRTLGNHVDYIDRQSLSSGDEFIIPDSNRKKSSFQITKIVKKNDTDEFEEANNTENADDTSLDASRATDYDTNSLTSTVHSPTPPDDNLHITPTTITVTSADQQNHIMHAVSLGIKGKEISPIAAPSRFKIVQIESKNKYQKGRWTCQNFVDPEDHPNAPTVDNLPIIFDTSRYVVPTVLDGNSTAVFAPIVYGDGGHPVLDSICSPMFAVQTSQFFRNVPELSFSCITPTVPPTIKDLSNTYGSSGISIANTNTEAEYSAPPQVTNKTITSTSNAAAVAETQSKDSSQQIFFRNKENNELELVFGNSYISGVSEFLERQRKPTIGSPLTNGAAFSDMEDGISSTVAIDNKIEQAMDLVKSHLMFAVREEVEVLKEQIKELVEKNAQLEYENKILREDATAETLAKLQNLQQSPTN